MSLFAGKKGLILAVANDRSIAWAIAKTIMDQAGECGFTHLPDCPPSSAARIWQPRLAKHLGRVGGLWT